MDKNTKIKEIMARLEGVYPDPQTALDFNNPHQLLVATILSAQCTDKRVNLVTGSLFKKYETMEAFAGAEPGELEQDIRSTGFYRNKAKNIIAASRVILERFEGRVPESMEELVTLPGVARKTANVVLSEAFGKQEGIAVDTHVIRLSGLLGLAESLDPKRIEAELMAETPREDWSRISNLLIFHGRNICIARRPLCGQCPLSDLCPSARQD